MDVNARRGPLLLRAGATAAALSLACGCRGGDGAPDARTGAERRDSAGVKIVTYVLEDVLALPSYESETMPMLRIGETDGPPGVTLNQVRTAIGAPDGGVVVADDGGRVVRRYDASGRYVGSQGGPGSGPGEYGRIAGLSWLPGDSLAVWDLQNARANVLDPELRFVRSLPLPVLSSSMMSMPLLPTSRIHGLGTLAAVTLAGSPFDALALARERAATPSPRIEQDTLGLAVLRPQDGAFAADTLMRVPGTSMQTRSHATGFSRSALRFGTEALLDGNESGFVYAHGSRLEVLRFGPDGRLLLVVRVQAAPRPVGSADREPIERAFRERQNAPPDPQRPAGMPPPSPPVFADHHPLLLGARLDRDGNAWLRPDTVLAEGRGWLVIGPDGTLRGWQRTLAPEGTVHDLGRDYVLVLVRDDYGVERVLKYPLRPPSVTAGAGG